MENVAIKGRGGNDVQHKNWKGKILRIWITIIRHGKRTTADFSSEQLPHPRAEAVAPPFLSPVSSPIFFFVVPFLNFGDTAILETKIY